MSIKKLPHGRRLTSIPVLFLLIIISIQSCSKDNEEQIKAPLHKVEIWAHRCNTVEKVIRLQHLVQGLELDVHFNSSKDEFYVKHDFELPDTLLFSDYLSQFPNLQNLKFWLDFKNLSIDIQFAALLRLNHIVDSLGVEKSHFIVEGQASSLGNFKSAGYYTCYYIPYFVPSQLTEEEKETMATNIQTTINTWPTTAISGYYEQLEFMQNYFPAKPKLTWFLTEETSVQVLDSIINEVSKDTTIKILLLPESLLFL
ncbi:MAG: hypothetical protein CVU06_11560 [Bacteroidetes bacterium HGW-Bacteroidetes-22]|nr:MAG: hypothetical protein CVU06_11560 [Bacteroidetes bacterium HGW-Bacteroidetes-22]